MEFKDVFHKILKVLFCLSIIILTVKEFIELEKQNKIAITNLQRIFQLLKLTNKQIQKMILERTKIMIVLMNCLNIFSIFNFLLGKKENLYIILSLIIQIGILNNPIINSSSGVGIIASAYLGIMGAFLCNN